MIKLKHGAGLIAALAMGILAAPAVAQPLDLSQQPIFLGTDAPANVLFLIDDSGSMDWEIVTEDAANGGRFTGDQPDGSNIGDPSQVKHRDDNNDGTADCTFSDGTFFGYMYGVEFESNAALYDDGLGDCNLADDEAWRFRNNDFNPLYYNPNQLYTPWAGQDINGDDFADINPTNAFADPYTRSETIDLTRDNSDLSEDGEGGFFGRLQSSRDGDNVPDGFRYYNWNDDADETAPGFGVFENGEEVEVRVAGLPVTVTEGQAGYPNSQTNFANWFSYYRSRTLLAKNAYGKVIADARNVRMGLVTINDNNQANTAIRDMDVDANKQLLLDRLYGSFAPSGGTPLRSAMNECGSYLSCTSENIFSRDGNSRDVCPTLSLGQGGNCQQNFLITMTDGFYNGASPDVGNTDGPNNGDTQWDGANFADDFSDTLADIAMRYYERDLAPNLPNNLVPIAGVDEATHQHVVSYTVAFGVNGTLNISPTNPNQSFTWPDPDNGNAEKVDDLRHAAYNGRGLFLDSRDPSTLAESLRDALSDIGDRSSAAAAVALNSGSLNVNSGIFQARFDPTDWSGQLLFLPVSNGSNTLGCTSEAQGQVCPERFDAGDILNTQNWNTQRKIITYKSDSRTGVPFRWDSLSEGQQGQLRNNPFGNNFNANSGRSILNYLRGERRLETRADLRTRSSVLGDIVNSDPVFVAAPNQTFDFSDYAAFRAANNNRQPVVYVGANDGMLHAFNASNGAELFAYVPAAVYDNLSRLIFANYNSRHRYFVDGAPVVGDVFLNSQWRSVLVSGLRGGGQGVFALDVTNPLSISESSAANAVMWEFTDADDPNLGFTYSQPVLRRMANGRWAAVVSSGYNNTDADGNASTSGRGYIFVLYLTGPGGDGVWNLGTDYERITLPAASGNASTPAGIAGASVISIDEDIDAEIIYAGDLNGNMWRVDVAASNPGEWAVSFSSNPLFRAVDSGNNPQPITVRPSVGAHPAGLSNGQIVYFGTGRFLEEADNSGSNAQTQSLYGIWDANETGANPNIARSDLLEQEILQEIAVAANTDDDTADNDNSAVACGAGGDCFRVTTDNEITYGTATGTHQGWLLDLIVGSSGNNRGERQVSTPILRENRLFFTTLLPSGTVCESGGDSFLMILDPANGGRLPFSPFDVDGNREIDSTDFVLIDSDGDGVGDERVAVTGRKSRVGIVPRPAILTAPGETIEYLFTNGSNSEEDDDGVDEALTNSGGRIGRILWRQIQ